MSLYNVDESQLPVNMQSAMRSFSSASGLTAHNCAVNCDQEMSQRFGSSLKLSTKPRSKRMRPSVSDYYTPVCQRLTSAENLITANNKNNIQSKMTNNLKSNSSQHHGSSQKLTFRSRSPIARFLFSSLSSSSSSLSSCSTLSITNMNNANNNNVVMSKAANETPSKHNKSVSILPLLHFISCFMTQIDHNSHTMTNVFSNRQECHEKVATRKNIDEIKHVIER